MHTFNYTLGKFSAANSYTDMLCEMEENQRTWRKSTWKQRKLAKPHSQVRAVNPRSCEASTLPTGLDLNMLHFYIFRLFR